MTEWLVRNHSDYANAGTLLSNITQFPRARTASLTVRTTIVSAMNDVVIPVANLYALAPHPLLALRIHHTGGHMGFVDLFPIAIGCHRRLCGWFKGET